MPIDVEIVSPEKRLLSRAVDMVVVPGSEGDLAAMPDHAPMIVLLRGGVVSLHEGSQVTDRFFVAGGFAEITTERCTILADTATTIDSLSRSEGETRLRDAEQAYDDADKSDVPGARTAARPFAVSPRLGRDRRRGLKARAPPWTRKGTVVPLTPLHKSNQF